MVARISNLLRNLDGKLMVTFEVSANPEDFEGLTDKDLELSIKKYTKRRSLDANALLWAMLGEMAIALHTDKWTLYLMMLRRYGKYTYVRIRPEAVEEFKQIYRECEVVGEDENSVCLICYFGSSTYTQEEFSHLLDGVVNECKEADIHLKASAELEELYKQWQR